MLIMALDGNSLAYRAFYALPEDMANASGQVTNAVYGFTTMLLTLMRDHKPDGVVVVFDRPEPTFRHEAIPEYKAQRDKAPDVLIQQLGMIRELLDILGVANDPRFATFNLRVDHRQELNELLITWCAARPQAEVLRVFEEADAAIGPVYDMADISEDPHFAARQMIQHLEGTPMQGLIAHLSHTPGALRWQGRAQDADGESIRSNGW
jgi:crotonobetainyl-CoA:carnitine CoA-transferase CaiB-like acyl-CoA transferase